jgi:hypothetical protein
VASAAAGLGVRELNQLVGSLRRSFGNREKSRSVVTSVAPFSSARAARKASITRGPETWASTSRPRRISQHCSPASRTATHSRSSQDETIAIASAALSGASKILGLVLMRMNARIVTHAMQTGSCPETACSSQTRQRSCRGERGW